jgi:hypothetical protein
MWAVMAPPSQPHIIFNPRVRILSSVKSFGRENGLCLSLKSQNNIIKQELFTNMNIGMV